jgi:hypothetical protein
MCRRRPAAAESANGIINPKDDWRTLPQAGSLRHDSRWADSRGILHCAAWKGMSNERRFMLRHVSGCPRGAASAGHRASAQVANDEWPAYRRDSVGPATHLSADHARKRTRLKVAWTYRTGGWAKAAQRQLTFETTLVSNGTPT